METALIKGNMQRIDAFRRILQERDLPPHIKGIVKLLIEDNFTSSSLKDVLDCYEIPNVRHIVDWSTLLLVWYAEILLEENDEITDTMIYSFEMLKLYFKIKEGNFYKYRKTEIEGLLHKQFRKLYADNKITKEESIHKFKLQDLFDLSYRQFDEMKEREVKLALQRGADIKDLDTIMYHKK